MGGDIYISILPAPNFVGTSPLSHWIDTGGWCCYREADPRLADIFRKKGAFLKMYTDYIRDFESMVSLLDDTRRRNPDFDKIVADFEVRN